MGDSILLPPRLNAAAASMLHAQLLAHTIGRDVVLDAQDTSHIGVFGAQVLLSARHVASETKASFSILNMRQAVQDQLSAMGLSHLAHQEEET
ncbi:STAS domain-containing protein [Tateyamaria omphalii]|uniref:STAS domain-containing protein n=1 Tax=Tateyamaria omphalii TaxID=299262 RepID=UPI001674C0E0|nr:STAS domain-containing protein [Tateyamaria omphalii]